MTRAEDLRIDASLRSAWSEIAPLSSHLSEAQWKAFLEDDLDIEGHDAAVEHISTCSQCADIFKSARSAALLAYGQGSSAQAGAAWSLRHFVPVAGLATVVIVSFLGRSALERPQAITSNGASSVVLQSPSPRDVPHPALAPLPQKAPVVVSAEQLLQTRGGAGNEEYLKSLARAFESYERNEFAEAARRLAVLGKERPRAFEPAFYLGVSLLLDDRPAEAMTALTHARTLASAAREAEADRWLDLARQRVLAR